ncbi:phosphoenolpyruvate carboxylase [Alloscardovia macacae]|uniref:Phosphoenolpyruvate carboxylase n=2 Tax=Alloscardovia macacae TaxID=1160091 RepID=A0A1Y2SUP6_9BIFI|nr:phosphoenolpyruvate carboxylase [Alloscardovia macacae]OTA26840.1 phosphoenolpyruvate carboxylase [Alloscardovia macacae]OTA29136.1 phosphoenolpyruvate carboxylase [Alloscardovia macacae]
MAEMAELTKLVEKAEKSLPERLHANMDLCLQILRKVLGEYDTELLSQFDELREDVIIASNVHQEDDPDAVEVAARGLEKAYELLDDASLQDATMLSRAFTVYFHLANLCEENYRVSVLQEREWQVDTHAATDPVNELTVAYKQLIDEVGVAGANELLEKLEFHPVFTAHPTEARRKAVEGKIRRIAKFLDQRDHTGGSARAEIDRRLHSEIDSLFRTSPIGLKKPTPVEEADTVIDVFDSALFNVIPNVYRRFDDWILGAKAGTVPPVCPAFFHPGSWVGTDRDGNPNVTAKVSRQVARKYYDHMVTKLEEATRKTATRLTVEAQTTPASDEMKALWSRQLEMSERLTSRASIISTSEPHRAAMLVMADRLAATVERDADLMYHSAEDFLNDLRIVQRSLAAAGAVRIAYGDIQALIWRVETFGFHMVEMEFRQHSVVHSRALEDIREHGLHGERGPLQPMTVEVLDTFRAIGWIQRRHGRKAAGRYLISFAKSAQNVRDVYELNRLAFANPADAPVLDVIPLFEQLEDLDNSVSVLEDILRIPEIQQRLKETGRRMEVMLGYSDSSKDAGPTSATLALHRAQENIAQWAKSHDIDVTLFHGRGGAVGRGGGPANRAVLAQPVGSVNCRFKLTEQGEVIFARYGNQVLATRHVESVAAATLLQSAPSVEKTNTEMTQKFAPMAQALDEASHARFLDLLTSEDFAPWFSIVTPLTEVGLLPIGSRPAKRGLGAKSLDDLRTIPWVFSWSQARINLAAWYGLGTACERFGDLATLREAYKTWPLFSTFIDNIEMSIAKTDERIARMYLSMGEREDLSEKVLSEMALTRKWVLAIKDAEWPLQHSHTLGMVVKLRSPYVDALSLAQVRALKTLRRRVDKEELSESQIGDYIYLILCTVSGVSAGLQNTG